MNAVNVPFLNIAAQTAGLKAELERVISDALDKAHFILGPNVQALEEEIARFTGAAFGIGVNSGSDALTLSLRALEIGPGDEVITTPFTYIAPAESIHQMGARIVFADIDPETYCLDPAQVESKLTERTRAVIPVHLFGQACDIESITSLTEPRGIYVVEDCAQAIGARSGDRHVGNWGTTGCFSFYPTKNLGANGDGGMIVTNDETTAKKLRMLRVHGVERRYHHDLHGYNSRLDDLQAAILRVKLKRLNQWNKRRAALARRYAKGLSGLPLTLPRAKEGNTHVWHVYALLTDRRDELQSFLAERGVGTLIYYPVPLHRQKVYEDLGYEEGDFPVVVETSRRILPLPMYPELSDDQADYVVDVIRQFPW